MGDIIKLRLGRRELERSRNRNGELDEETKARVYALIDNPTVDTWDNAKSIIVGSDAWTTLWQAVRKADPSFPNTGRSTDEEGNVIREWSRIPDASLVLQALALVTK